MNSKSPVSTRLMFCLTLLFLASCQKIHFEDFIHPDKTPKYCSIKRILSYGEYNVDTLVWNFNYNQWGDPSSVRLSNVSTGRPEFLFYYDNHRRLTDFVGAYEGNFGYEFWHHYVYQGNKIIRDTVRPFGFIVDGKPVENPQFKYHVSVHYFEYDNYDRIIKNTIEYPLFTELDLSGLEEYSYSASGNLERYTLIPPGGQPPGIITYFKNYDNKVNLHRTNKIWMFIDRNYSINNEIGAVSYNKYGLPSGFRQPESGYRFIHSERNISESDIQYNCK